MKDKAGSKISQKAHKFKDITLEIVGRKTHHMSDKQSHNGSEAISLLSEDNTSDDASSGSAKATKRQLKLRNLPRPPKTLSLKKGTSPMNKNFMSSAAAMRTEIKDTIDQITEQHMQSSVCSPNPSSIISPANSYDMSTIDADGFLFSPQSSLGFLSPSASIDELGSNGNLAFDVFSDASGFGNFEALSTSNVHIDDDSEMLAKELNAAILSKCNISSIPVARKPLLPPSRKSEAKAK